MEIPSQADTTGTFFSKCVIDLNLYPFGNEGYMLPKRFAEWAEFVRKMPVSNNDIWLLSFPRSGNTWAREMVGLFLNDLDFEEAEKHSFGKVSSYFERDILFDPPSQDGETTMERISKTDGGSPRLIKSHLPLSLLPKQLLSSGSMIIYVERNPKDVCVSDYHLMELLFGYTGSLDEFSDAFLADNVLYAPYWTYVKEFLAVRNHANVLCLTYEEMKLDIKDTITRVAKFLGKSPTSDEISKLERHVSFDHMRSNDATNGKRFCENFRNSLGLAHVPAKSDYIRKGIVGSWKDEMSEKTIRKFDAWITENSSK